MGAVAWIEFPHLLTLVLKRGTSVKCGRKLDELGQIKLSNVTRFLRQRRFDAREPVSNRLLFAGCSRHMKTVKRFLALHQAGCSFCVQKPKRCRTCLTRGLLVAATSELRRKMIVTIFVYFALISSPSGSMIVLQAHVLVVCRASWTPWLGAPGNADVCRRRALRSLDPRGAMLSKPLTTINNLLRRAQSVTIWAQDPWVLGLQLEFASNLSVGRGKV
eukprot:879664-Amphidinium_carterae.2